MSQQNVLLVADDGEFARTVMSRWQSERLVPAFTVLGTDLLKEIPVAGCDLVVVGPIAAAQSEKILELLRDVAVPVIVGAADASCAQRCHLKAPRLLVLRLHEGWSDALVLLGSECLRRVDVVRKLEESDKVAGEQAGNATLGRYMLEMRHSLNNALTSVLGNAELLLLEPDAFTPEIRDQLQTIHSMSLRIHEILMRFSSLEIELGLARRELRRTGNESLRKAAGWTSY